MREWIEVARCDLTQRRIIPAEHARAVTIEVDGDSLFGPWDVDAELDKLAFTIALRDHLTEWIARQLRVADDAAEPAPPAAVEETRPEASAVVHPIESPQVTTVPPVDDPAPTVGEADHGRATDTAIRRWNRQHKLTVLPVARQMPGWLRAEYERLDGAAPDEQARERAARLDEPPAVSAAGAAGQDAAGPDQHHTADGSSAGRDPAAADTPDVEPIGQGDQARPAGDGHAAAVAMAEKMLSNRSTPKAVADATGLDVAEVRDLETQLRKGRKR